MDSTSHSGLHYVFFIIDIYDFVDIKWDSVKYETIVDIHSFGILFRWVFYHFFRPNFSNFTAKFLFCSNVRGNQYEWSGTLFLVT